MAAESRGFRVDVPAGESLIAQLARLCAEFPTAEKTVVVPSLAVGHQLGDRLARVRPWINLRFETIRNLVDGVVGFDIAEQGLSMLSRAQSLALVEQACRETLTPDSYFGAIADRPGFHRAIQKTLDDLRHAGVSPADYASQLEDRRKGEELQAILSRYQELLREHRLIDRTGALHAAIDLLRATPPERSDAWAVVDLVDLSPAEELFLRRLSRGTLRVLNVGDTPRELGRASFFTGVGEENEFRQIFRRILGGGIPFDQVEIVYSAVDPYLAIAHDLASELDIPCTFADGRPARLARAGQAALGFIRWIASDFEASKLRALCLSGTVRFGDDDGIHPSQLASLLLDSGIGWGRDRYATCLAAYAKHVESRIDDETDETKAAWKRELAARAGLAAELVGSWLALVPASPDDRIPLGDMALAVRRFVERHARTAGEDDAIALKAIVRLCDELAALPSVVDTTASCCDRLESAVNELLIGVTNPCPGAVHVSPLRAGGYCGRRHVFFVGLDDSRVPGAGLQDPILLDSERVEVNARIEPRKLPLFGDTPRKVTGQFHRTVALAAGSDVSLAFSWSSHDLLERRLRFPAAVVLELFRTARGDETLRYEQLVEEAQRGEGSFIPAETPLDLSEWWLARLRDTGREAVEEALARAHPGIAGAREAAAARERAELTAWDGLVGKEHRLDPRESGKVMSASQLETLAGCPRKWFFQKALRIRPLEETERDAAAWLDALQLGILVHSILETFVRGIIERGETIDTTRHAAELTRIADAILAEWRDKVPPGSDAAFEQCRESVLRGCAIFLAVEERAGAVRPWDVEVAFGSEGEAGSGLANPVTISLGGGKKLLLRGRIDRIDRDGESNRFEIWDYKSGSTWKYRAAKDVLRRGTLVQPGLYRLAAEAILRARGVESPEIVRAGYYFPTEKGNGEKIEKSHDPRALRDVLNHLCDLLADGVFPRTEDDGECGYCDFRDACEGADVKGDDFTRKTGNDTRLGVLAWRALKEVP